MLEKFASKVKIEQEGFARVFFVLATSQLIGWGTLYYGFSLFVEPMHDDLGWSRTFINVAPMIGLVIWGLSAPIVGQLLHDWGGRPVMTVGSLLGTAGLILWGFLPTSPEFFLLSWILIGMAMAAVLYEPAFFVLATSFKSEYKKAITLLTLIGGLASTVTIPLLQFAIGFWGWKNAILCMAAANLLISTPLHVWGLPPKPDGGDVLGRRKKSLLDLSLFREPDFRVQTFIGLSIWFAAFSAATAALTFLLIPVLSAVGVEMSLIIFCVALIGLMQVVGRGLLLFVIHRATVFVSGLTVVTLVPLAIIILITFPPLLVWLALFAVCYGTAKGIMTIVKGTAVVEQMDLSVYARTNGWLSFSSMTVKAGTPVIMAAIWGWYGEPHVVLWMTLGLSLLMPVGLWMMQGDQDK